MRKCKSTSPHPTQSLIGCVESINDAPTPTPAGLKLTEIEQAIKTDFPFLDKVSYGNKQPNGKKWQVSRERIEAHDAALWQKRYVFNAKLNTTALVEKLAGKHIAAHQRGEYELLTRSSWAGGRLLVRFESDPTDGQTDDLAVIEHFKNEYLPSLIIIASNKGYSGYISLEIPYCITEQGEVRPTRKLAWMNQQRELMHKYCQALAAEKGFKCAIEVHGSFLQKHHHRDENEAPTEPPTIADGAMGPRTTVKLPRFTSVEQVTEFAAALVAMDDAGYVKLMADGKAAFDRQMTKEQRHALQEKRSTVGLMSDERVAAAIGDEPIRWDDEGQLDQIINWKPAQADKRAKIDRVIVGSDDKPKNARACIVRARQILGIHKKSEFKIRRDETIDLAHTLHDENHISQNHRDKERDTRFASAHKFLHDTFDDAKAGQGNDPYWYDDSHLDTIETKLISTAGILDAVEVFNKSPAGKHGTLTTRYLADVACCIAKNTMVDPDGNVTHDGECPVQAIKGMMRDHGRPDHGSMIKAAINILTTFAKPFEMVSEAIKGTWQWINGLFTKVKGKARRFQILKWHWFTFLPQPAPQMPYPAVTTVGTDTLSHGSSKVVAGLFSSSSQYKGDFSTPLDTHHMVIDLKQLHTTPLITSTHEISPKTQF